MISQKNRQKSTPVLKHLFCRPTLVFGLNQSHSRTLQELKISICSSRRQVTKCWRKFGLIYIESFSARYIDWLEYKNGIWMGLRQSQVLQGAKSKTLPLSWVQEVDLTCKCLQKRGYWEIKKLRALLSPVQFHARLRFYPRTCRLSHQLSDHNILACLHYILNRLEGNGPIFSEKIRHVWG